MSLEKYKSKDVIVTRPGKVIYREGDTIVKLFDETYPKVNILNEALNHAKVEESGLPIPKLLEVVNYDDLWGIRIEHIEGPTLASEMKKNPDKEDEYLKRLLKIQLSMFAKHTEKLNDLKAKLYKKIKNSAYNATIRYELHTRLASLPSHDKICHGDFEPSNIILHPDGTDYIIDWSHATSGNASADVALSYLLFKLKGEDEFAEKYLDAFCLASDTPKQYVQKWMPICAAARSTKEKSEEQEFLAEWVNIMEYE